MQGYGKSLVESLTNSRFETLKQQIGKHVKFELKALPNVIDVYTKLGFNHIGDDGTLIDEDGLYPMYLNRKLTY